MVDSAIHLPTLPQWVPILTRGGGGGSLWKTWLFGRTVPDWRGGVALVGVFTGVGGVDLWGWRGP